MRRNPVALRLLADGAGDLAGRRPGRYRAGASLVALVGGLLVIAVGASLLIASFAPAHPLGIS